MVNPLMSCSARLPVYLLFAGVFFKEIAGAVVTSMYLLGIFLAGLMATIFRKFIFGGKTLTTSPGNASISDTNCQKRSEQCMDKNAGISKESSNNSVHRSCFHMVLNDASLGCHKRR